MSTFSDEIQSMKQRLETMAVVDDETQGQMQLKKDIDNIKAEYEATMANILPLRYQNARLDDFMSNDTTEVKKWLKSPQDALLIQSGTSGTGKTHFGYAVLVERVKGESRKQVDRLKAGGEYKKGRLGSVRAVTFSNLILELKSTFDGATKEVDVINRYCKVGMLFIDDIGAEKISTYAQTVLYTIINNRYNDMRPTVITTNLDAKQIADAYGQRMVSRIASGVIVKLEGKDRRLSK